MNTNRHKCEKARETHCARLCPPLPAFSGAAENQQPENPGKKRMIRSVSPGLRRFAADFRVTQFCRRKSLRANRLEIIALKNGPPTSASARIFPEELFFSTKGVEGRKGRLAGTNRRHGSDGGEKPFSGPPLPKIGGFAARLVAFRLYSLIFASQRKSFFALHGGSPPHHFGGYANWSIPSTFACWGWQSWIRLSYSTLWIKSSFA